MKCSKKLNPKYNTFFEKPCSSGLFYNSLFDSFSQAQTLWLKGVVKNPLSSVQYHADRIKASFSCAFMSGYPPKLGSHHKSPAVCGTTLACWQPLYARLSLRPLGGGRRKKVAGPGLARYPPPCYTLLHPVTDS